MSRLILRLAALSETLRLTSRHSCPVDRASYHFQPEPDNDLLCPDDLVCRSFTSSALPTTSTAPATSSSVVAPETLSLQPSQTAAVGGGGAASFEINNILDLGSLAAGFGEVVCNGNERCAGQ